MTRPIASLGTALILGAMLALANVAVPAKAAEPQAAVYGTTHVEAALTEALARHITVGRLRLELDNRAIELRVPAGQAADKGLVVENLYYSPVQARFAAELVVPGTVPAVRLPVGGRAYGTIEVPVLNHRVAPGDTISSADIDWIDMRADQTGSDTAASEAQLLGMTPKRGIPVNQPVRVRDLQSPRIVDKGSLVTITLTSPNLSLSAQGKALQDGGRGDVIRVVNTQSNRVVEAVVAGPGQVAVKLGTAFADK